MTLAATAPAAAQPAASGEDGIVAPAIEPISYSGRQSISTADGRLAYTVRLESYEILSDDGAPSASIVATSYIADHRADTPRPITFLYNGGPGAASLYLHLGFAGPHIADIPGDATDIGAPPYRLAENPATLLRASDLVFIDPVGTGFSRALPGFEETAFWGLEEDAAATAEFIRLYLTRNGRWNSPRFLMGESYGTIRSSLVARLMQESLFAPLNGVILISPAMNLATLPFYSGGSDLSHATHLPAIAAVAHYHGALPNGDVPFEQLIADVREFAATDYLTALFRGDRLSLQERNAVARRVHGYTGLSVGYILASNLRIDVQRFRQELLREHGIAIGLLDSRYTAAIGDRLSPAPAFDPTQYQVKPGLVALWQDYLRGVLGVTGFDRRYVPNNRTASANWVRSGSNDDLLAGFVDVTPDLLRAAEYSPGMRIFVGSGYHDLTTSFFAGEYMMQHSGIPEDRYELHNYPGGHMMYLDPATHRAMADDIVRFIEASVGGPAS